MHFQLPRVSEPGFRIKRFLHFNILRSQVAHPPLVSPEPHGFYTFGCNVHFGSWLLPASGLLRLFASRIVTLKIQGRSTSAESSTKTQVVGCPWHGWVSFGRVTSLGNGPMDSVQVGKAVFVKEDYTTLGIEPRTYSYPGRSGNHYSVSWVKQIYDFYSYFFFVLLFTWSHHRGCCCI